MQNLPLDFNYTFNAASGEPLATLKISQNSPEGASLAVHLSDEMSEQQRMDMLGDSVRLADVLQYGPQPITNISDLHVLAEGKQIESLAFLVGKDLATRNLISGEAFKDFNEQLSAYEKTLPTPVSEREAAALETLPQIPLQEIGLMLARIGVIHQSQEETFNPAAEKAALALPAHNKEPEPSKLLNV